MENFKKRKLQQMLAKKKLNKHMEMMRSDYDQSVYNGGQANSMYNFNASIKQTPNIK